MLPDVQATPHLAAKYSSLAHKVVWVQGPPSNALSPQEAEAVNIFNQEMLMTALPAAFEGAFAQLLLFLKRRSPDPDLDCLYNLLKQPGSSQPAADMFGKVSLQVKMFILTKVSQCLIAHLVGSRCTATLSSCCC